MPDKYILNEITNWSFLPWKKIYNKISVIQYKILNATKNYNLKKLYQLQKKLLNSNEIKILAIKNMTEKIYLYYLSEKKSKVLISNQQKLKLLKNCYNDIRKNEFNIYFLIKQIEKWIIYLSLKSEWKAKFISNFNCYKKSLNKELIINSLNKNIYKKNKFNFVKIIIQKIKLLKCNKYIESNQFLWINNIYLFIYKIYFYNIYWYIQYAYKLHNLLKNKNNNAFVLNHIINLTNNIDIKNSLYNKKLLICCLSKYNTIYLNQIFSTSYAIMILINSIKLNYISLNNILFYQLRKNLSSSSNKDRYLNLNSKYLNQIFYILQTKHIYNIYCF